MSITAQDISDAMRKNGYPQITSLYVRYAQNGKVLGACAIGQAYLNLKDGNLFEADDISNVLDAVGITLCPVLDEPTETRNYYHTNPAPLGSVVIHLNDDHYWSTTQIADFIDEKIREQDNNG